jgi:hypothetical protein
MPNIIIETNKIAKIYGNTTTYIDQSNNPSIIFDNSNQNINTLEYFDYSLFRVSIMIQSAYNNNQNNVTPISKYCIGQIQIYPKAFIDISNQATINQHNFLLNNEIEGSTNYKINENINYAPNGRLFYSSFVMSANILEYVIINCKYQNNKSILSFLFNTDNINLDESSTFIYSIQVELLNPGKLNKTIIKTINFNDNI